MEEAILSGEIYAVKPSYVPAAAAMIMKKLLMK
jgi:hypothetical protein